MRDPIQRRTRGRASRGHQRQWIKVEAGDGRFVWVPYARFLWEQQNGPVPPGYVVIHLDGDTMNDDPSNIAALSRREALQATKIRHREKVHIWCARGAKAANGRKDRSEAVAMYGSIVTRWECAACGADFIVDPETCPKCGSSAIASWGRRTGIEERLKHTPTQEEIDTDDT
jgi:hypothetical protein